MSMSRKFSETGAYSLMQICTWSFYSILLSFSGNILRHFGFSDSRISLFLGSAAVLSLCVQLLVGTLSGKYPNLQVRLCGWNVLWNNLSKKEQDEFIFASERAS